MAAFPDAAGLDMHGYAFVDDAIARLVGHADDDVSVFASVEKLGLQKRPG